MRYDAQPGEPLPVMVSIKWVGDIVSYPWQITVQPLPAGSPTGAMGPTPGSALDHALMALHVLDPDWKPCPIAPNPV